jgi:hypothetical protein
MGCVTDVSGGDGVSLEGVYCPEEFSPGIKKMAELFVSAVRITIAL